nr:glycoside hydrolase family 1 [Phyllotreta armoraciae]
MFLKLVITLNLILSVCKAEYALKNNGQFPRNFMFGAASSAYQIEGSWNEDGKGLSTWDHFVRKHPSPVINNATGDVACDSYRRWKEDIKLIADLGVQSYRFSISWPRILPSGYDKHVNEKGLEFYKQMVQEILKHGMVPVATIFHWDLPQFLFENGLDWTNEELIDVFVRYARFVIRNLPEVGYWITVNEPRVHCRRSYGEGVHAPGVRDDGIADYKCTYNILKAHAAVYRMYKREFPRYKAKMGMVVDCQWYEPASSKPEDVEAAERHYQFECGMYLHPIFKGDWPSLVKHRVAERSRREGYPKSRLPAFTSEEIKFMRGTQDFLGVNHYITTSVANVEEGPYNETSFGHDIRVSTRSRLNWEISSIGWGVNPTGVRSLLNKFKDLYNEPDVMFTEIGVTDDGKSLKDEIRVRYFRTYFCNILEAMQVDKVSVVGIIPWSAMDSFEWTRGYEARFGFYAIDFVNDPALTRRPKMSVNYYKSIVESKRLHCNTAVSVWNDNQIL